MLTSLATELRSPRPALADCTYKSAQRTVFAYAEVMADRRQLLYALTLPEYIETWVTLVDASRNHEKRIARIGAGYTIEYREVHGQTVIIEGVFRTVASDKVVLTWRRAWPRSTRRGLVTIRLSEASSLTRVALAHSAVMSEAEYRWLCDSWQISLGRFRSLFDHCSSDAFDGSPPPSALLAVR